MLHDTGYMYSIYIMIQDTEYRTYKFSMLQDTGYMYSIYIMTQDTEYRTYIFNMIHDTGYKIRDIKNERSRLRCQGYT